MWILKYLFIKDCFKKKANLKGFIISLSNYKRLSKPLTGIRKRQSRGRSKVLSLKFEGRRRRWQMMRWFDGITNSVDMFEQTLGVDGQGSLEGCSLWGSKELDRTELLNWTSTIRFLHWEEKVWKFLFKTKLAMTAFSCLFGTDTSPTSWWLLLWSVRWQFPALIQAWQSFLLGFLRLFFFPWTIIMQRGWGGGRFFGGSVAKKPPAIAGDTGLTPNRERSHMPRGN